jgi:heme oxygenase (mycobilin-producing)
MKGRVVFLLHLKPGRKDDFLQAYEAIRLDVAHGVKGHIVDQVCQSPDDPNNWLITSEWESLDEFLNWERTPEHQEMVKPMRACWDEARSLKFVVREETGH